MNRLALYLNAARRMGPTLLAAKVARRLGLQTRAVRLTELLNDPKAVNPARLTELYDTLARAAEKAGAAPVSLTGRRVLEIGAGPLGGLGPTATVDGASAHLAIDPFLDPDLLASPEVEARYLVPALSRIAAVREAATAPDELLRRYRSITEVFLGGLEELLMPAEPFDMVVSISCLEHIQAFDAALARLRAVTGDAARQIHLVNFSNHTDKKRPFSDIYDMPPEQYAARYGPHINLMRPSDVTDAFGRAGFNAVFSPVDVRPDAVPADIHPWWRERYGNDELAVRTGLLIVS